MNKLLQKQVIYFLPSLLTACGFQISSLTSSEKIQQSTSSASLGQLSVNLNQYPVQKIVCDPLTGGQTKQTNYSKGIKAELFYKNSQQPRMYKSTDYIQFAQKSEQNIFLSDMNVPTRMFTEGFANRAGQTLNDDQGQKLIEYFGLKMMTNIILSAADEEGFYEFALLSDDGTTMSLKSGSADIPDQVLIQNDGDHPTKMGCSSRTLKMRRSVMAPVEVTFYQGPRYHIAHVLIWRKSTEAGKDSLCNQLGNNLFFNPDHNSDPMQAFKDLQSRGWKILTPDNFMMAQTDYNPCVMGTKPVISHLALGEVVLSSASLSWTTDIMATSQVQITNLATNEVTVTPSDNQLRTSHQVYLSNLNAHTAYKVKVISVSSDLGRSESSELTFQTQ
jgi:hypothetical protein